MSHWTEKWVGRRYIQGEFECGDLVCAVVFEQRGIVIPLPTHQVWKRTAPTEILSLVPGMAERTHSPGEGDGVLMRIVGRRGEIGSHVGVYVPIAGESWVLHCIKGGGTLFQEVGRLSSSTGLEVEGFYRWVN